MLHRIKYLSVFLKDPDKKDFLTMSKELIQFAWTKKVLPTDYFRKYLYRKDVVDCKNYLSFKEFNSILLSKKLIFPSVSALLNNKLSFNLICKAYGLNTPELISYNIRNQFYFDGHVFTVLKLADLLPYFEKIFTTKKTTHLFLKPIDGMAGKGCFLVSKTNLLEQLAEIESALFSTSYLHEAYIEQHPLINTIHSKSINTLRIVTYMDKQNEVHLVSVFMRFGVGNSITDNTGTGGCYVGVSNETGKLEKIARQGVTKGGRVFYEHPDSQVVFEGFEVPLFKEACDLAKKANLYFPNRIIGWDVAITVDGPVIIEGNHNLGLLANDVCFGGYCKHPIIKSILEEIKSV